MLPYEMMAGGNFLATASRPYDISLVPQGPSPDFMYMRNRTQWGASASKDVQWEWHRGMAQGTAQVTNQSAGNALTSVAIAADGFSFYDNANTPVFAPLATTSIAGNTGTFVVLMASTGSIAVGDYVRLYATTGELQIAGYSFQVTAVTANVSITLGYMASSGITFAAAATAGQVLKFIPQKFYPRELRIANITQNATAKVYFTQKNDYTPGERVSFRVSSAFGMSQINNVFAQVLGVTNSATESSIVINLDTTGFSAFVFPTSAVAAAGVSPAVCVPAGSVVVPDTSSNPAVAGSVLQPPGTNLLDSFDNRNTRIIHIGASMFANVSTNDVIDWFAFKFSQFNGQ